MFKRVSIRQVDCLSEKLLKNFYILPPDIQQQNKHLNSPTPIFNTPPFQNGGDGTQQTFSPTLFNNGGGFLNNNGGVLPKKRPHILKQIFIPLPPKNSQAAQEIEAGAPISSPVLDRLPLPIRMVVSQIFRQQLKKARLGKCSCSCSIC